MENSVSESAQSSRFVDTHVKFGNGVGINKHGNAEFLLNQAGNQILMTCCA